ncbi:MAG TPA: hypothetical protein VFU27_03830, partial [Terriglobales bacterium]|nr:hypothetical protein [Terriglobales bacterium]
MPDANLSLGEAAQHESAADLPDLQPTRPRRRSVRISWEVKAVLPVVVVLLNGLVLFVLATVSLEKTERHALLLVASSGAVAICAVMIVVLAFLIERPMRELQEKIAL